MGELLFIKVIQNKNVKKKYSQSKFIEMNYLLTLGPQLIVPSDKLQKHYQYVRNVVNTEDRCFSCTRPASYNFYNTSNYQLEVSTWYCGYCAAYVSSHNTVHNEVEIIRTQLQEDLHI